MRPRLSIPLPLPFDNIRKFVSFSNVVRSRGHNMLPENLLQSLNFFCFSIRTQSHHYKKKRMFRGSHCFCAFLYPYSSLPKRIVLVRHGESEANIDPAEYGRTPDWKIGLTQRGFDQAAQTGRSLRAFLKDELVCFYVSPYKRAQQTLPGASRSFQR